RLRGPVDGLEPLGVWTPCGAQAAPLCVMRIIDDTVRLLRAPEVSFEASEIGLPAFGHNIENRHLSAALITRARELPALVVIEDDVAEVRIEDIAVTLKLGDGTS